MSDVFDLSAKLTLDSSAYVAGLTVAKSIGKTALAATGVAIAAATTAVVAFGVKSVQVGAEFDEAMSQVAATMGLTSSELAEQVGTVDLAWGTFTGNLREYAQEMGENTAFSATECAEALNYMALAGYDVQTSMEMLPNVLNLAAAGSMDLATASDMVTDTQTAFGISLERTNLMVDEMAKAASTGNTSVEQLGEAFLTVGGLAQELNGGMIELSDGTTESVDGIQELEIALTAMANAGIKGSEAGTHMRNMLLKLASPTADGTQALEALGVTVFDTEGNMRSLNDIFSDLSVSMESLTQEEKLQAISDLFNTRDTASAEALLSAVSEDWDEIGENILDAEGAAQLMADVQLDNLSGDITLFQSALEGAQIAISDTLTPSLREFVQFGTEGLGELTDAFQEGGLSGAMNAFGTVLSDGLNMVVQMLPEAVDAGLQLIGALASGIVGNAGVIGDAATEIVETLGGYITDNIPKLMDKAPELIEGFFEGLTSAYDVLTDVGVDIINSIAEGIAENGPAMIESGLNALLNFSSSLRENAGDLVDAGLNMIVTLADAIIDSLPVLIETLPQIITNIAGIINDNAPKLIVTGVEIIGKLIVGIIQAIPALIENFPKIIEAIWAVFTAINWATLGSKVITGIANGVKSLATKIPTALKSIGKTAVEWLSAISWKSLGADIIDLIVIGVKSLATKIPLLLKSIMTNAVTFVKEIDWLSVGKYVVMGIWSGLSGATDWIKEKIKGWVGNVLKFIKSLFGIASPSKVMRDEVGIMLGKGMAIGIERSESEVQDAMDDLVDIANADVSTNVAISATSSSSSTEERTQSMNELLDLVDSQGSLLEDIAKALDQGLSLNMNKREFARLVAEV